MKNQIKVLLTQFYYNFYLDVERGLWIDLTNEYPAIVEL